jgi:hypothetical protein
VPFSLIRRDGTFSRLLVALIGGWSFPPRRSQRRVAGSRATLGGVCSDDFVPRLRESGAIRLLAGSASKHGDELGSGLVLHAEQHAKLSKRTNADQL